MNLIVTYRTIDEYVHYIRYNNMTKTLALLATCELADFKDGSACYDLPSFYREADANRPKQISCSQIDASKNWALLRITQRNGNKVSRWLYIKPAFDRGMLMQRSPRNVEHWLRTSDGWAWAQLNLKNADGKRLFIKQQANNYTAAVLDIDKQIEQLRAEQASLRSKAAHRLKALEKLS